MAQRKKAKKAKKTKRSPRRKAPTQSWNEAEDMAEIERMTTPGVDSTF